MSAAGARLFCRFAFPPNSRGYCGPNEVGLVGELLTSPEAEGEMERLVPTFEGAWPYLELIASSGGLDPLDPMVVEAYWIGSGLLDRVGLFNFGNSLDDRFRRRAGRDWGAISAAINGAASPTHSFHVFCVYPWVGMLRSGIAGPALTVLDRCRIRWGTVKGAEGGHLLVETQPLVWDGRFLELGEPHLEAVLPPPGLETIRAGELVAMHWDYVCQPISASQGRHLRRAHHQHLALANAAGVH
jgi:hypothetical protein